MNPHPFPVFCLILTALTALPALAGESLPQPTIEDTPSQALTAEPSPQALEAALQSLPWEKFRAVVESEPKLKADVDAYGPLGWAYVKQQYRTYGWSRSIERIDPVRRRQLADAIRAAKGP